MKILLPCLIGLLLVARAHAAEEACPSIAEARQALALIANKVTDRATAVMNGDGTQMEALLRSARIAATLVQYRDQCLQKKTGWAGALKGDDDDAEPFGKYARDIDLLVRANVPMQRIRNAKRDLDESGPKLRSLAQEFVKRQSQRQGPKTRIVGRDLPTQIGVLLDSADRIMDDEKTDPESVFLMGKNSSTITQSLEELPETFRQATWGHDAKGLGELSAALRKEGTKTLIAAGGMLANVQQLVMAKRALADLKAIEATAVADFAALLQ